MSLQFNVSQLLKGGVGEVRAYDFAGDEPLDLDGAVAQHISGKVKFTLTNFGIIAHVDAHAVLDLTCARCVESFEAPADVSFEEEYAPSIDIVTGLPSSGTHNDTAFDISATHTIDLSEALRQHFLLAVELVPLCDVNCRGLCPSCGTNLNRQTCSCAPERESGPFAALGALLHQSDSE